MKLFDHSISAQDKVYIALRDCGHLADARNHVEELWQYFEPYADPHFSKKIAAEFRARYWEMYLSCLALRVGLPLLPSNGKGPDLRITLPTGRNLFIEATAPGPGIGQNRVSEPKLNKAGDFNAIFEDIPVEQVGIIKGDRDDPAGFVERYSIRHQIIKHNDEPIRTNYFLDSEYRGLSAVIFSDAYPLSLPKPDGREFKLVHNPYAENPVDRGLFKIGCEYWVEGTRIRSTNWNECNSSS